MTDSFSITIAPNGGRKTKADHPALPITPAELVQTARESLEAGAAMIHVHVRKADGSHLLEANAYREALAAIEKEVGKDLLIQITSEAVGQYSPEEQSAVIRETRPEAVSLALREFLPDAAHEKPFIELLQWIDKEKILPQIILFDKADVERLKTLQTKGNLPWNDVPVLYVLGRYTVTQTSRPEELLPFVSEGMPRFKHWTVCAFGAHETACVVTGALLGGHARVGFENNFHLPDGELAENNAALVASAAYAAGDLGLTLQDADALRGELIETLGW